MHYLAEYGIFFAKLITVIIAILILLAGTVAIATKGKYKEKEKLEVNKLNDKYDRMRELIQQETLNKHEQKALAKQRKAEQKVEKKLDKQHKKPSRKKMFVVSFHGDLKASAVVSLRNEITAILTAATPQDEVVVNLESMGGVVHGYGLAASQLMRLRTANIPLTIIIDKIAASGGYMMACVGNKILAAPFAIIGSIGVIAQLPNFNKVLKKHHVDYEQITAGKYKRTLTLFGENTKEGREKFKEEIEEVHQHFKDFIVNNRPAIDIERVATGEYWQGIRAFELKLIDELRTSDDYLLAASKNADIYEVKHSIKKSIGEKVGLTAQTAIDKVTGYMKHSETESRYN